MTSLHNLGRHLSEGPETDFQKLSEGLAALDNRPAIRLIESEAARRGVRVMPEDRHRELLEAGKKPRKRQATVENIMDMFGGLNLAERRLAHKQMAAELVNHATKMQEITGSEAKAWQERKARASK